MSGLAVGRRGLSSTALLLIAAASMTLDHLGVVFFGQTRWLHGVGRIAFVLFAFVLAQGAAKTHSRPRFALRLLAYGLLCEPVFDALFYERFTMNAQNVLFTLLLGLLAVWGFERAPTTLLRLLAVLGCMAAAQWLHTDYQALGVLLVWLFWYAGDDRLLCCAALLVFAVLGYPAWRQPMQFWCLAALPLLWLYNGQRGGEGWPPLLRRRLFYVYYPGHLALLMAARALLRAAGAC